MTDVRSAVYAGVALLSDAGVDSPRLDTELLLAHTLGLTRTELYAHLHDPLNQAQQLAYEACLQRRSAREPLAYILGRKSFYDFDLAVDRRVLVPRPETEHLVERACALGPHLPAYPALLIADVGTGSGALAIALARHFPQACIVAIDNQHDALAVARHNIQTLALEDRVRPLAGDLLTAVREPFSLIVANLPYIAHDDIETLAPEIEGYEPRAALDGGPDGLDVIRRLLPQLPEKLAPGGVALLEIGDGQAAQISGIAGRLLPGWTVRFHEDYAGHLRVAELSAAEHDCAATV
ncbi:MAG: peptide chain release factor N(5)-glutamine methyltransferase [Chloroflexi bacterium]|nr:peptide chain release factor N(5)-glutamine methyltransferase [Chloroflexota bacterium]